MPASPPSSGVRVAAAVAPCARDPRTRTDLPLDPRLQSLASFHQTAVVLPTQAKPSSTVTSQPDTAAQVEQTDSSAMVENIFDRLLRDLAPVKSKSVAVPHAAESATSSAASAELKTDDASALAAESCVSKVVREEADAAARKLTASPRPATGKPDDVGIDSENASEAMHLKASLQQTSSHLEKQSREETTHSVSRHSDMAYDVDDAAAVEDERDGDRQHRSRAKSSRHRASSQDRDVSKGRLTVSVSRGKDKDAGPAAKRMRNETHPPDSVPTDFM